MVVPIKSVILFITILCILFFFIYQLSKKEKYILLQKKKEKKKNENNLIFKGFILKNAIIAGAMAFIIGIRVQKLFEIAIDTIVNPLFSVDFDNDGHADFSEITNLAAFTLLGIKFSFGPLLLTFIKFLFFVSFVYILIIGIYKYTNFIDF